MVATFLRQTDTAYRTGNVDWLLAHLHPAVIKAHGESACRKAIQAYEAPDFQSTVLKISGPATWTYTAKSRSQKIKSVLTVKVKRTQGGKTGTKTIHLVSSGATMNSFSDCVPAAAHGAPHPTSSVGAAAPTVAAAAGNPNLPPDPPTDLSPGEGTVVADPARLCWSMRANGGANPTSYRAVISKTLINRSDTSNINLTSDGLCVDGAALGSYLRTNSITRGPFAWHVAAVDSSGRTSDASPCWSDARSCHGDGWWTSFEVQLP
jgi:hypothetical protein